MAASGAGFANLSINIEARLANLEQGLAEAVAKTEAAANKMAGSFEQVSAATGRVGGAMTSLKELAIGVASGIAGAFAFNEIWEAFKKVNEGVAAFNNLKLATGSTVEALSALEDVGARTGTSMGEISTIIRKFNQDLLDIRPNSNATRALEALGLDAKELRSIDPSEALRLVAVAFSQFADDGNKARAMQLLFNRSVGEVAPFLSNLAKQTELVGKVTEEAAEQAEKFANNSKEFQKTLLDVARDLAGPVVSALLTLSEKLRAAAKDSRDFFASLRHSDEANDKAEQEGNRLRSIAALQATIAKGQRSPEDMQRLNRQLQQLQAVAPETLAENFDGPGETRLRPKPSIAVRDKPPPKGPKIPKDDPTAKDLAARLAMLDDGIKKEELLLSERNQFLDLYNARGLISYKDFYQQRQNIADEAFVKEEANQLAKIADLKKARDAALADKNPKDKPQEKAADLNKQLQAQEARLAEMRQKYGAAAILNTEKSNDAETKYIETIGGVREKIFELTGDLKSAAGIRFDAANKSLLELAEFDPALKSMMLTLREEAMATADVTEATDRNNAAAERLAATEQSLGIAQARGAIGELSALASTGSARQEYLKTLEAEVRLRDAIAATSDDPLRKVAADKARAALEKFRDTVDPVADKINGIFETGLSRAFDGFISGSRTAKQAFGDFAKSVINDMFKIASQDIAKSLFGSGSIGGLISGLLGGGKQGVGPNSGIDYQNGSDLADLFFTTAPKAVGGVMQPNNFARVNEHGPEMLTVQGKDYLMTGGQSARVTPTGWQGSAGTNINVNIASGVSRNELAALIPSLKAQIKAEIAASQRRPGYAGA